MEEDKDKKTQNQDVDIKTRLRAKQKELREIAAVLEKKYQQALGQLALIDEVLNWEKRGKEKKEDGTIS